MKLKEVLELTQSERLADVAKNHLEIGEKVARQALKNAGCYSVNGKRGWFYDGAPEELERSLYDFLPEKSHGERKNGRRNERKIKSTNKTMNQRNNVHINQLAESKPDTIRRKRASFDIDAQLLKQLKLQSVQEERHLYEIVEEALYQYIERAAANKPGR